MDDSLVDSLHNHYVQSGGVLSKASFSTRIRDSKDWVRKSRRQTNTGYERLYRCKTVQKATLIVHSPDTDMSANAYVFCIDEKPIRGGKTKMKSAQVTKALSKQDKTTVEAYNMAYITLSEKEIESIKVKMDHGDIFMGLEIERD